MGKHRDYITWINPDTNQPTTFIDQLLEADMEETGGANVDDIENLKPDEQYAIYRSGLKKGGVHLTSASEMYDDFAKYALKKGAPVMTRGEFIESVQVRTKAVLVKIGGKEFIRGIGLKHGLGN